MRSSVCKIEKGTGDLGAILAESEKVARYIGLDRKEAMKLRLICEEVDGLLPNITDEFEGDFWIDYEDGVCKVNVSIRIPEFNATKKKELISLANDKRNAAAVGIIGKIRNAIENFFLSEGSTDALDASSITFHTATGYSEGVDYSYLWSLQQYKDTMEKDETETWDELEKSVITSVADDIIVSIRGNSADIVIVKRFI